MDKKTTDIVAYITPIGWIIAMCAGDKEGSKFQLNQTLVLWLAEIILSVLGQVLGRISLATALAGSLITGVGSLFCFICWIIGLIGACQGADKPMPLFSSIKILK